MRNKDYEHLLRPLELPYKRKTESAVRSFSPSERLIFGALVTVLVGSTLMLLSRLNEYVLVEVPRDGGSIVEGVIGSPRFINPLLAASDADRDLSALVYAGLLRPGPDGVLVPELAERFEISPDGLVYTFTIKGDAVFHDGTPVTADDVVFTARLAQDPILKSPRRASWEGVFIEKIDDYTVQFILSQPYSPFLENTTLGILPKHIWGNVSAEQFPFSQFNIEPVGAGPYVVDRIRRNSAGLPEFYELKPFKRYVLGKPFISSFAVHFYANENTLMEAFEKGDIEAINSISPERIVGFADKRRIERVPLSRVFGVFFNQDRAPLFANGTVRQALDMALDKNRIVREVLEGYGAVIYNPIPPGLLEQTEPSYASLSPSKRAEEARRLLEEDGWALNEEGGVLEKETDDTVERLSFKLATSNTPELKEAATLIKEEWESIGASVELQFFDTADLNTNVIRPRQYDALLFGEIVGRELDLFAFWHSSQRNDPGLNIALYANITTDKLLADARRELDRRDRLEQYRSFEEEIRNDVPAVFVYTPDFAYLVPDKLKGLGLNTVTTPSDRFANVHRWYIETDNVWTVFAR